jgi:uncharacterized protein YllA (UPF0747 family)
MKSDTSRRVFFYISFFIASLSFYYCLTVLSKDRIKFEKKYQEMLKEMQKRGIENEKRYYLPKMAPKNFTELLSIIDSLAKHPALCAY